MQNIFSVLLSHLYHFLHSCKVNDFILTRQINPLLFLHGLFLFTLTPSSHFRVGFSASVHSFFIYINSSLFFLKNQCKGRRKVRRNTAEVDEKRFFCIATHKKSHASFEPRFRNRTNKHEFNSGLHSVSHPCGTRLK